MILTQVSMTTEEKSLTLDGNLVYNLIRPKKGAVSAPFFICVLVKL